MQRLEVSGAVRHIYIYMTLGGKGLITKPATCTYITDRQTYDMMRGKSYACVFNQ
jgi:hypothetical protein